MQIVDWLVTRLGKVNIHPSPLAVLAFGLHLPEYQPHIAPTLGIRVQPQATNQEWNLPGCHLPNFPLAKTLVEHKLKF